MIRNRIFLRLLAAAAILGAFFGVFGLGVLVGHTQAPPFAFLHSVKSVLLQFGASGSGSSEDEFLEIAFSDPAKAADFYWPASSSLQEIAEFNERIFIDRKKFPGAYERLKVIGVEQLLRVDDAAPALRINFELDGLQRAAFAFGAAPASCDSGTKAALIIPGSGPNQTKGIFLNDPSNYHFGIRDALGEEWSQFVLVKPNEDFRAWRGPSGGKLTGDFIFNFHLNRGGSYSVSYLVESLALSKWMDSCFTRTAVVGLSQGGAAALLNAMQAQPDVAVIASGFSVLTEVVEWSGHNQLIGVPGYGDLHQPGVIVAALGGVNTMFLFTWGSEEVGTYRIDAEGFVTGRVISGLPNVTALVHGGGHVFPVTEIRDFLNEMD